MRDDTEISIVMTTYRNDMELFLSLSGYLRQTESRFEIIVVNDGGPRHQGIDKTKALVESFKEDLNIKYFYLEPESELFRISSVRNLGIRNAVSPSVMFTDADCVPSNDVIELMARYSREDRIVIGVRKRIQRHMVPFLNSSDLSLLGNLSYSTDRRLQPPHDRTFLQMKDSIPDNAWDLCWGCLFSAPLIQLKTLGGFDEQFYEWGGEDVDMAERLARAGGCRFYALPQCFVYHLDHHSREAHTSSVEILKRIRANWTPVRNNGPL